MKIPAETSMKILRLIEEGSSMHPTDLAALHRWTQATYETLQFNGVQQQRFNEHCRSPHIFTSSVTRLRCGVSMLKQALYKNGAENFMPIPTKL